VSAQSNAQSSRSGVRESVSQLGQGNFVQSFLFVVILKNINYHQIRINAAGLDVTREDMALDVIKEVGPRGHFLKHRHTRKSLRQRQFSDITAQIGADCNVRDPIEVARAKVDWILENHQPEPLGGAQQAELTRIIQAAERELDDG